MSICKKREAERNERGVRVVALICALVLIGAAFGYALPVHGEEKIYDAVIRLHVIAHSDAAEDQADKLAVRDAVLACAAELTKDCRERDEAQQLLLENQARLEQIGMQVLCERGRERAVRVELGQEKYPTRSYDSFCFPAGEYLSLRVMIGDAAGQNFWCVLFPPMCLSAASVPQDEAEDAMISVGLTPAQYRIVTETQSPKYKLRFRLLEVLEDLFG